MSNLEVCPHRYLDNESGTGILVRALYNGKWINADIATLDKESLLQWLRSRGGENKWAENTIGILLGHGHLHEE